jgi:hypothetical protein
MKRKTTRRGSGKRVVQGKDLRLADEVRYIQNRAADHDARIITLGPLVLFSTDSLPKPAMLGCSTPPITSR